MNISDDQIERSQEAESKRSEVVDDVLKQPSASWLKRISMILLVGLCLLAGFGWYAYQATQTVPEYYQQLLEQPVEELAVAGDEFETEMLEFQNVAIELGEWQARFSQDQINGWLATDMPEKFPRALPKNVSQPRVSLANNEIRVVFQYESKRFSGIIEACGDVYCTEKLNQIAVRIQYVKSGLIRLPIAPWTERISKILARSKIQVSWTEDEGDMIALFDLPAKVSNQEDQKRVLQSIEILDDKIAFRGLTMKPEDVEAYQASRNTPPPNLQQR